MIKTNKLNDVEMKKIRTVTVNERGQLVIPEDIRNDFEIKGGTTLVMIKTGGEIVLRKESEVIDAIEDESWSALSSRAMAGAWGKEDEIWDKLAKRHGRQRP